MNWKLIIAGVAGLALGYLGLSVENVYLDFFGLVAATIPAAENIIKLLGNPGKTKSLIISWGTGLVLTIIGAFITTSFLYELLWWQILVTGVGVSVVANWGYDKLVKALLEQVGALEKKKK